MLGEQPATVVEVSPLHLHGVVYYDLVLNFRDDTTRTARLGHEAVPQGLRPGDDVLAMMAANMVVSIRRP